MSSVAFVFSGQGAQQVGMARDLADAYPVCRAVFEEADEILGYALSDICFEGPPEALTRTNHCQPGIFLASVACYRALEEQVPDLACVGMAGLSLGEWTALHLAGVLSFEDTLRSLEARGRLMQEACESTAGGMLTVIGLEIETVESICEETGVELANINSPGQLVLSGRSEGIESADRLARVAGAKRTVVLEVAGAYHSELMAPAAEQLAAFLEDVPFAAPEVPVASNASGALHGEPEQIRKQMVDQVTTCVRWVECVEALGATGVSEYIECGPGKVLSGLIKRIDRDSAVNNIQNLDSLGRVVDVLK